MVAPAITTYEKEAGRNTKTIILEIVTNAGLDREFPITHSLGFVPKFVELVQLTPEGPGAMMTQAYGPGVHVLAPNKGNFMATTTQVWIFLDTAGLIAPTTGWFQLRVGRTHSTAR